MPLEVITQPGTERWRLSPQHEHTIATRIVGPSNVRLEYWPRDRAHEVLASDFDRHPDMPMLDGYWYEPNFAQHLRGYSYGSGPDQMAVVFVDRRETYASATFVVLHELAHLMMNDADDDEIHADLIAAMMMRELGYPQKVIESMPEPQMVPISPAGAVFRR